MEFKSRFVSIAICYLLAGLATPLMAAAPTLTSISEVSGNREDTSTTITLSTLRSLASPNAGSLTFRLKSITQGTMNVSAGAELTFGSPWTWTPSADQFGAIQAFQVVAYDGTDESATPVQVTINVPASNDAPSFTKGSDQTYDEDAGPISIANWATNISKGPSNESDQTLTFEVTNNTNAALFSAGPAVSANGTLTFTTALNANGNATISLKLKDSGNTQNNGTNESPVQTFTITVNPVNDPPAIGSTFVNQATPIADTQGDGLPDPTKPLFGTITITDPDAGAQVNTVITISKTIDTLGVITTPPSNSVRTESGGNYIFTISNRTPAQAQADIRAAQFKPTHNAFPVGVYDFDAKIEVSDTLGASATPLAGKIYVESVNNAPAITFSLTPSTTPDNVAIRPFRVAVSDLDLDEKFSLTVTETTSPAKGTFGPITTVTGTAAEIATAIQNISYTATPLLTTGTSATFKVSVTDIHPDTTTGTPTLSAERSLTISFTNGIPEITGVTTTILRTTDDPAATAIYPFANVTISDSNSAQTLTVTLSADIVGKGTFSPSATFSGSAAEVTAAIRQVVFIPTANRLPVNQSETVILNISVTDGEVTRSNNQTEVVVTSVNGAPAITYNGAAFPTAPVQIAPLPNALPFASIEIADEADVVVTVSLDNAAKGSLVSPDGKFIETPAGSRSYRFTGSYTDAQASIRLLQFVADPTYQFPVGQPGRTDFTIRASDNLMNQTTRVLPVVLISAARNFLVTSALDSATTPGTLRHAIANAAANDVITFALESYPATIRLLKANGPLLIEKHLNFKGPGADKLTITGDSNSNGSTDANDVQIFRIFAAVEIDGIKLARGFASNGGAIFVGRSQPNSPAGSLRLINSAITDSVASQWGGAIDVTDASITVENSLFARNSTGVSSGLGGGAVSLFTNQACSFINTTFSENAQRSTTGYGGGAIFAENDTPSFTFATKITHCTFSKNVDARNRGSSIQSNVSNSKVTVINSIFADFSNRNLYVAGGGEIISQGGNLSNDNTTTEFIVAGNPQSVTLLNHAKDKRNIDPLLSLLGSTGGQTEGHTLTAGSPAIAAGIPNIAPLDQRGVLRDDTTTSSDSGAIDATALGRIIIHEIAASQTATNDFIEFYNPRNQGTLDLTNYELWIDGTLARKFTSPLVVKPGFGFIVGSSAVTPATSSTPVITISPTTPATPLALKPRGKIEIRKPNGTSIVASTSYVSVFANQTATTSNDDYGVDSLTLAPQFGGAAMIPHRLVLPPPNGGTQLSRTGDAISPGADTGNTPFGQNNAYPIATVDRIEVTEDEVSNLKVLANDLDSDGSDKLFIVDVNTTDTPATPTNSATALSLANAAVSVDPAVLPLRGTSINFDPRFAFNSLPEGARVNDQFAYSIIDVGAGSITGYATNAGNTTKISAPGHRLASGETISISGSGAAAYNGVYQITSIDADSFSIPVAFTTDPGPAARGNWQAAVPRTDTARATALVQLTVLGRNDPPTPLADTVATKEDTVLRILGDQTLVGTSTVFDTDGNYALPRQLSALGILSNDTDPDTDDSLPGKLHVVGVCQANGITGYAASGNATLVTATGHGLTNGAVVLISGYGGHPSYNGYHTVTVTGPDTFTIPVVYIDNASQKGLWAILGNETRLTTTSSLGASVTLEIRANRSLTNIVYNPRTSAFIDGLKIDQLATDNFYYAVEDSHGAVSLAKLSVTVTGTNDITVPTNDPIGLNVLNPLLNGATLPDFIAGSSVLHLIPGNGGSTSVAIRPPGGGFNDIAVIENIFNTTEDTLLSISMSGLLANDTDIDRDDQFTVEIAANQTTSRKGATITRDLNIGAINYNPANSATLQALARGETVLDTFEVTVFDGTARVTSTVAVLVKGLNDRITAANDSLTTPEKTLLEVSAPGILANDIDIDHNVTLPDNRKLLLPAQNVNTTVFGAKVNAGYTRRDGTIDSFTTQGGVTVITSAAHGINTGEEVVLTSAGSLTGQYSVTRLDDNRFTIPVPFNAAFTSLSGQWTSLKNSFAYDPRQSLSTLNPADMTFTLQGLAVGQTYVDTFTYTVLDNSFLFANDDIFRIEADRTNIELKVLLNDTNLDGIATSRSIVEVGPGSAGGTIALNGSESILYTPETGFVGDEIFTYTIADNLGNRATATVTARVTINRLNGNLQANNDSFTIAAGQTPLLNVIANDDVIPATGDPLTITAIASAPSVGGTATIENGAIRFTPNAAITTFPYTETFSYTISGGGTATATATVTLLVVDRANTLNVRADAFTIPSNTSANPLNVLANDNILPGTGTALQITAIGTAQHGTATLSGNAITYTPAAGFLGIDSFTYSAADGFGGTGTATITVTVGYLVTNTDFFSVGYDNPLKTDDDGITTLNVLRNDGILAAGGGEVTITSISNTSGTLGTLAISADGKSLTFDPAAGQTGQQEYGYTITDATGRTASSTVTIVVVTQGVRANSDFFTVQTDSIDNPLAILANDLRISTIPGTLAIASIGTGPNAPDQGGSVTISEDLTTLIYTAAPGFRGVESFTYTVTDGDTSDTARISIRSTSGELVAGTDSFIAFRGSSANVLNVLANDRVIPENGDILTITATDVDPSNTALPGQLAINDDGTALIYTPNAANTAYPFIETFSYEISDGTARRAEGIVRIEVLDRIGARNLDTNDDAFTVRSDSGANTLNVLANDNIRPATADAWTITSVTAASANVSSPILAGDFLNSQTFAAKLTAHTDPVSLFLWNSLSSQAQAILANPASPEVSRVNTLIAALNSAATGPSIHNGVRFAGITLREQTSALLAENPVGEQLIVLNRLLLEDAYPLDLRRSSGGGNVAISGSDLVYVPQPGFVGFERFTYRVSDGLGGTGFGEVIVRVGDVSVSQDSFAALAGTTVQLDVVANDGILRDSFPAPSAPASADFVIATERAIVVSPANAGSAQIVNGLVSYSPPANFAGLATLTYFVKDDSGFLIPGTAIVDVRAPNEDRASAVASITVTGVNDAPLLLNMDPTATNDKTVARPFPNATVIEFDNQRLEPVTLRISYPAERGVLSGAFTVVSPGVLEMTGTAAQVTTALRALTFAPFENRINVGTTEDTTFTASLTDGRIATPVIYNTSVLRVTPVNDAPSLIDTEANQLVYKFDTLKPLANVNIIEVDNLNTQVLRATVRVPNPTHGTLSGGGFIETATNSRIYTFTGTPANVVSALRLLVFTPTPGNRVTPTSPETVPLSVELNDNFGGVTTNTSASILVLHAQVDKLLAFTNTIADDSQANAEFGTSVAVSGDTMVVGAPRRDTPAVDAGRVYVYQRGSTGTGAPWRKVAQLTGSNVLAGDLFGTSVAIEGDTIVVGAPSADTNGSANSGAVYVFQRDVSNPDAWNQTNRLISASIAANESFGTAVSINGATIIVGAPQAIVGGVSLSGKVYSYERNFGGAGNWGNTQTLLAPFVGGISEGSQNGYFFGASLAIDGNDMVIGAYGENRSSGEWDVGTAVLYKRTATGATWTFDRKLSAFSAAETAERDQFGYSVDISNGVVAVGAPGYNANDSGAIFVFERNFGGANTWGLAKKILAPATPANDLLGLSVALSNDSLMAGAPRTSTSGTPLAGSTYVYRRNTGGTSAWGLFDSFSPGTAAVHDRFGYAVALDGFTGAVGAIGDNANVTSAANGGSVRIYQFHHEPNSSFNNPVIALEQAYTAWAATKFSANVMNDSTQKATVWGANADPDGDGSANLIEMLFGTGATVSNVSPVAYNRNSDGTYTVTHPNSGQLAAQFVHVEWSADLATWTRQNVSAPVAVTGGNFRTTITPPTAQTKMFIRIFVGQ